MMNLYWGMSGLHASETVVLLQSSGIWAHTLTLCGDLR